MKRLAILLTMAVLAGCGGRDFTPPRNLDNACALYDERPHYRRAIEAAERRWGIPAHVLLATIHQESRFVGDARPPYRFALGVIPMGRLSSALGYSQALDGTWQDYLDDVGNRRADRTDIRDATDFMGWYMTLTAERNGVPLIDARNQYLAYHEGHAGFDRGSYNAKPWLLRVADRVADRAAVYQAQLLTCR